MPIRSPGRRNIVEAGQRLFVDVTGVLRSSAGLALMPRVLDAMEARSAVVLRQLSKDPRLTVVNRSLLSPARSLIRIAARTKVPVTALRALVSPKAAHRHAKRIGDELAERLTVPETATASDRLDFAQRTLLNDGVSLMPRIMPAAAAGFAMLALASRLLGDDVEADELQMVMRGLPDNVTTEMDLALWNLAARIRADAEAAVVLRDDSSEVLAGRFRSGDLPAVAQRGLSEFFDKYGHRAVAEIDLGMPRWSEDPRHIFGVLANYLRLDDPDRAPDVVFRAASPKRKR